MRRKLKVNAGKSKVMISERKEAVLMDFSSPCGDECDSSSKVLLGGEVEALLPWLPPWEMFPE